MTRCQQVPIIGKNKYINKGVHCNNQSNCFDLYQWNLYKKILRLKIVLAIRMPARYIPCVKYPSKVKFRPLPD